LNVIIEEYLDSVEHKKLAVLHPSVIFKAELDSDLLNVSCSPTHIKKSLMNLVMNASEAIEGRGAVTISTANRYLDEPLEGYEELRIGEYAVLSVSDDGLGLAIVWNTIQDHEGYTNVKSSEKGTIFQLYFPVSREEVTAEKEENSLENYLGHGEKINGRETFEKIIKIHPNQKAIIASGFSKTEDVKATQMLGAGKYIKKPYTLENIAVAVKEELEK